MQISLGRGTRKDFVSGLRVDGDKNMSDKLGWEMTERGSTERDYWKGRHPGVRQKPGTRESHRNLQG